MIASAVYLLHWATPSERLYPLWHISLSSLEVNADLRESGMTRDGKESFKSRLKFGFVFSDTTTSTSLESASTMTKLTLYITVLEWCLCSQLASACCGKDTVSYKQKRTLPIVTS